MKHITGGMIFKKWDNELLENALAPMVSDLGRFPTLGEMRDMGRNDMACQVTKRGGSLFWAEKMKTSITESDTVKGWRGEEKVTKWLFSLGLDPQRQSTQCPFDILVNGCLRIDVKTASFAKYGPSSGWFYRMGKRVPCDVVVCYRTDKDDFYAFPLWLVPSTNLTITPSGVAHTYYRDNASRIIMKMLSTRLAEGKTFPEFSGSYARQETKGTP
jgi:hypothetical protein